MATIDVYQLCVCGSGKKLKFCCMDALDDIQKIETLLYREQFPAAATAVEAALKRHPNNLYLNLILVDLRREKDFAGAAEIVARLLEKHPENPELLRRQAGYAIEEKPLEEAKEVVSKTIQKIYQSNPELVANLALGMGTRFWREQHPLAARERFVIAMRLGNEELQRTAFNVLMEFDAGIYPYPLRGPHFLLPVEGTAEENREVTRARRMADLTCTASAVRIYRKLSDQRPEDGNVWYNLGLMLAWDGQPTEAVTALRRASALLADREKGIEAETVALLLANESSDRRMKSYKKNFRSGNVAQLISRLDDSKKLSRMRDMENSGQMVRAAFRVSDREIPDYTADREWNVEDFPSSIANLIVVEQADSTGLVGYLVTRSEENFQTAVELLKSLSGDLIELEESDFEISEIAFPNEYAPLFPPVSLPTNAPPRMTRQFRNQMSEGSMQKWKQLSLEVLGNRTPVQAASDPAAYGTIRALITELDSMVRLNEGFADVNLLYGELGIAEPPVLEIGPDQPINALTSMEIVRLRVEALSDEQLKIVQPRALMIGNVPFAYRTLDAAVNRPGVLTVPEEIEKTYQTLSTLALRMGRFSEALEWQARDVPGKTRTDEEQFLHSARKALEELQIRLVDPDQNGLTELLDRMNRLYARKLPQLLEAVTVQILQPSGITPPWSGAGSRIDISGSSPSGMQTGGLWTPGAASSSEESPTENKLWIPGA